MPACLVHHAWQPSFACAPTLASRELGLLGVLSPLAALVKVREAGKKLVISCGDVAASGGVFMAVSAPGRVLCCFEVGTCVVVRASGPVW